MLKETVIDWSMTVWVTNIARTYGHVSLTPVNDTKFMDICHWLQSMTEIYGQTCQKVSLTAVNDKKKCHWLDVYYIRLDHKIRYTREIVLIKMRNSVGWCRTVCARSSRPTNWLPQSWIWSPLLLDSQQHASHLQSTSREHNMDYKYQILNKTSQELRMLSRSLSVY